MKNLRDSFICVALLPGLLASQLAIAAVPTVVTYAPIEAVPPNVQTKPARPLTMLNMSKDHQLFYRAYNEFSDYNGDGSPDGTYLHTVRYSGYFDTTKCYSYGSGKFAPSSAQDVSSKLCTDKGWHGNFLNWATMTRIDIVRKVLYGGYRFLDSSTATILERASLPMDAHSFAKYYANAASATADQPAINTITPFDAISELTMCNTTVAPNGQMSQTLNTTTYPPLVRVVKGNYSLWNAHERRQCRWAEESSNGGGNGNNFANTGLSAASNYPSKTLALPDSSNDGYVVRVEVCNKSGAGGLGGERCRGYPSGSLKPIGLLHEYGENNSAEFGLMTGSFSSNIVGGVLRKNATTFRDEVNYLTNGTFITPVGGGIVSTLDRLRIYGYDYGDGTYQSDGYCTFQITGLTNNRCTSWGNPIGETFIETLRYLNGGLAQTITADDKGAEMGLPVASWADPLPNSPSASKLAAFGPSQCRRINNINFNASVTSYDNADAAAPDEPKKRFLTLPGSPSLDTFIDLIGSGEGIHGTERFFGRSGPLPTDGNGLCTAKTVTALSLVNGICPVGSAYYGSYALAGAAYWANLNPVRPLTMTLPAADTKRAYRVRSYSVALAPGAPRIKVTSATSGLSALIQPAYLLNVGNDGSGALVDFRVISQTATSGSYLLVWEDSEQGGDYDSDVNGILSWRVDGNTLYVATRTFNDSTANPQGFGYTISGTNKDGVHFHSGILGFTRKDAGMVVTKLDGSAHPNIVDGGCSNCQRDQDASQAKYTITGTTGGSLEDPMWYAAKWGGFRGALNIAAGSPNDDKKSWDAIDNLTGAAASAGDGKPDNYYEVFNPDQLEEALRSVFEASSEASNAAPAVSSSQLISTGLKYVASFNTSKQNGDVQAFALDPTTGSFKANLEWSAGEKLTLKFPSGPGGRQIITNNQTAGFPFTWTQITSSSHIAYRNLVEAGTNPLTPARAEATVNFMRGDRSEEGNLVRSRDATNILGAIVSASPWLQEKPSAKFFDSSNPGYSAFVVAQNARAQVLWSAADDGMLHASKADTGDIIMSYVPEALAPRFNELGAPSANIQAFVDGSPFSADIDLNAGLPAGSPAWRTYVFGSLGRGGNGVFALDATNVSTLTNAESNSGSIFKWQFTANDDADLGHILSDISIEPGTGQAAPIVKIADGRFAMIFGNGYGSKNGNASLYILPVQGPNASGNWSGKYYKITVNGPNNGLSTPTILDTNNDGRADTVYAGDLKGNLWKFDISDANPANWKSAYSISGSPAPLFVAFASDNTTRLPIVGAPQFTFPSFGGVMLTVGTGLSVKTGDFPNVAVRQRVFGIWDRPAFAAGTRALPGGVDTLVPRTLVRNSANEVTVSSAATVDFENVVPTSAKDGWYFDLPDQSEMVLSNIEYRGGNVFFTSVRPPADSDLCSDVPRSSFYLFDPILGFASSSVLGLPTVGSITTPIMGIDIADQKVRVVNDSTGRKIPGANGTPVPACADGTAPLRVIGKDTDKSICFMQTKARFQWREIPGLRTK